MLNGVVLTLTILGALSQSDLTLGRTLWAERDGKPVFLHPRRFSQEQPAVISKVRAACPGQVCGVLSGQMVTPLLAAQPECSQQDVADAIIDASKQFDPATQANMLALAKEYRQSEKNTPPDFSVQPPINRNSVFCQKAPKNPELNCLVQAQDPANDPDVFFDPALGKSVTKGSQANTAPFCQGGQANNPGAAPVVNPAVTPTPTLPPANPAAVTTPTPASLPSASPTPPTGNAPPPAQGNATPPAGGNLQTFTGALGAPAPGVTALANGQFQVANNASFKNLKNARQRSCDVQKNQCANAANASGNKGNLTVAACETQHTSCIAAAAAA